MYYSPSVGPNGAFQTAMILIGVFDLDNSQLVASDAQMPGTGCDGRGPRDRLWVRICPRTMVPCMPRSARRRRAERGSMRPKVRVISAAAVRLDSC